MLIGNRGSCRSRAALGVALTLTAWFTQVACSRSPRQKEADFLKRGQSFFEKHDYGRALLEFKNAARIGVGDAEPHYRIGLAEMALDNSGQALVAFRKATELNPAHTAAQLKLSELQTSSRDRSLLEDAGARLREILKDSPDNLEASDLLAMAEWKLGNVEEALQRLEDTLQRFPKNLTSSVLLTRLKLSQRDFPAAEGILQAAVNSAPDSSYAWLALAELHTVARKMDQAETEMRKAIQLDSENGRALLGLAAIQIAAHRLDQADETYRRISALPGQSYKPLHAIFLYRYGKPEAALDELKNLARADAKDAPARRRVIAAALGMGKFAEARSLVSAELKRNPKDIEALSLRGELNLRTGNRGDAQKDLQQVVREKPDSAAAHMVLAMTFTAQDMDQSKRQELNRALELDPGLLNARLALARSYTVSNQARLAIDLLEGAPGTQKFLTPVTIERNWALLQLGDTKSARPLLERALATGRDPVLVLQEAILRLSEKDYAAARKSAEELLAARPDDIRAARIVAESYAAQNQLSKAVERLSQIAQARPNSTSLQHLLAVWSLKAGDATTARRALDAALAADPHFVPAELLLADLDRRENHGDAATRRLTALIARDPANTPALLMLAEIEAAAGNRAAAIARYRAVLAFDRANLVALNNAAYQLVLETPDAALPLAQKAAEIAPDNPAVQDTLGWVYYRKGIYRSAIGALSAAVAKEPTPRRRFHLAMSYIRAGDGEIGRKLLQAALQQDPRLSATEQGW